MSELFMSASQKLRDELVTQLQKEVNFLKNYLAKSQKPSLIGTKVIVVPSHRGATLVSEPTDGILMSELSDINTIVMIVNEDNVGKIIRPFLSNIIIPNANQLFK
tara:strand:+ start:516 stop:830 length:315 start_codon:yes stop_codon:yes gene_type:complete